MLEINPAAGSINGKINYTGRIIIVENVSGNNWKVKAGLNEFAVISNLNLKQGEIVNGRISAKGNTLYLSIFKKQEEPGVQPVFFIDKGGIIDRLAAILFQTTGSRPDKMLTAILESLVLKKEITRDQQASLAGEAYLKGFKTESSISTFLSAVSEGSDQKRGGGHGRGRGREKDDKNREILIEDMISSVSDTEKKENALFTFNHLKADKSRHWIIIPFQTGDDKNIIKGSLRLKTADSVIEEMVINAEKNSSVWFFHITEMTKSLRYMKIYCDKNGAAALKDKNFAIFMKKLQNLGVKIDDNIYDLDTFSGFSVIDSASGIDLKV